MLDTVAEHRGAYWLVVDRLLADLGKDKLDDNCGQKPERLWYGNTNAVWQLNDTEGVPQFLLEDISYDENISFQNAEVTDQDVERCRWLLQTYSDHQKMASTTHTSSLLCLLVQL